MFSIADAVDCLAVAVVLPPGLTDIVDIVKDFVFVSVVCSVAVIAVVVPLLLGKAVVAVIVLLLPCRVVFCAYVVVLWFCKTADEVATVVGL